MAAIHRPVVAPRDDTARGDTGQKCDWSKWLGGRVTETPETPPTPPTPQTPPEMPLYKGEPLEPERGPGLGCFWMQVIWLGPLLVMTPLTVSWHWPFLISGTLLTVTLILLLFAGKTV